MLQEFGGQHGAFTVFPFRGGEWVMLFQNTDHAKAKALAEELVPLVKACTKLSCSVGISGRFKGIDSLHECCRGAQRAMLRRFTEGRERVYCMTPTEYRTACAKKAETDGQPGQR